LVRSGDGSSGVNGANGSSGSSGSVKMVLWFIWDQVVKMVVLVLPNVEPLPKFQYHHHPMTLISILVFLTVGSQHMFL
jgi:hypothetical protein